MSSGVWFILVIGFLGFIIFAVGAVWLIRLKRQWAQLMQSQREDAGMAWIMVVVGAMVLLTCFVGAAYVHGEDTERRDIGKAISERYDIEVTRVRLGAGRVTYEGQGALCTAVFQKQEGEWYLVEVPEPECTPTESAPQPRFETGEELPRR